MEIINKIKKEFYDLLANPDEGRSELISKVLNYLKTFRTQIFTYRHDSEHPIDNLPAERVQRLITVKLKNCLLFGSMKKNTEPSNYNTVIETCKLLRGCSED